MIFTTVQVAPAKMNVGKKVLGTKSWKKKSQFWAGKKVMEEKSQNQFGKQITEPHQWQFILNISIDITLF